ncbi:MAG: sulfatase [Acidobacteria bacterium]|nr:sulfatase [Acidobacteriota bacterium]
MKALTLTVVSAVVAASLPVGASQATTGTARPPDRPNIVLIVADDLNTRLGTYGYPVRTPNIDALARRGVQFDRAYVQYSLCNPSRASLLSGRRPASTGISDNDVSARRAMPDGVFLPQHFRQHGYLTARVGKIFHISKNYAVNLDDPFSWDETINERIPDQQALEAKLARERRIVRVPGMERLEWAPMVLSDDGLGDGYAAERTVEWLQRAAKDDRPFFLAVGFRRPHLPWEAPKRYFDMYPPEQIVLPDEPLDDTADIPPVALKTLLSDRIGPADRRQAIAAYSASTSYMDAQVGKVVAALDRLKLAEKTVIIFMGDHGYHLGEHGGMWQKQSLFEEGARFPLIIAAPGRQRGRKSARVVEALDLYPTLAELAGIPPPKEVEGRSLVALLDRVDAPWDKPAVTEQVRRPGQDAPPILGRTIRTERWRYTEWDEGRAGTELYDHDIDPHEYRNLAASGPHGETVRLLKEQLRRVPALGTAKRP